MKCHPVDDRAISSAMSKRSVEPVARVVPPKFTLNTLPFIEKAGRQKKVEWLEKRREEHLENVVEPLQAIARYLKAKLAPIANGYHFPQRGLGRLKRSANSAAQYGSPLRDYISYSARRPAASRFDHNPSIFLLVYPGDEEGDEVLLAGGLYMPSSRQLKSIRQAIANDYGPFKRLFASSAFKSRFPDGFSDERKSKRPPRGFDPNHVQIELLKHQGYFVWRSYKRKEYTSASFGDLLVKDSRQILKLNSLLEQAIEGRWVSETKKDRKLGPVLGDVLDRIEIRSRHEMDF
jgi:uncharacterized protein (TIGR02453 family)